MGFPNGISEPIKRYLGECPECQAQFETGDPTKRSITTAPCPSCDKALCSECPTRRCEQCDEQVCQDCAIEYCEAGWVCKACLKRSGREIDGYSADEYADRQTNILSGIDENPMSPLGNGATAGG